MNRHYLVYIRVLLVTGYLPFCFLLTMCFSPSLCAFTNYIYLLT